MANITLTPSVLRALGEGVARLQDGDPDDCRKADEVIEALAAAGYVYGTYNFVSRDSVLVVSYACRQGADFGQLSASALALVCGQAEGVISLNGFDYRELGLLSEDQIARMAKVIRVEIG